MRRALAGALLCAALLGGCGKSPEEEKRDADERVIHGWSAAVNDGRYEAAADYFAPGAVVEQLETFELATHEDAVRFNRGLPCRADVTGVEGDGFATVASFSLRLGRNGQCAEGGRARVRFVIRDDRIHEWRQLLDTRPPLPGESI